MVTIWKTEYLLQLDEIDEQHEHFFSLCGDVAYLAETITSKKHSIVPIIKALGVLRGYAFQHFRTEEELMLKFGFPGYLKHTGFHNSYLEKMMFFEKGFKALLADTTKEGDEVKMLRQYLREVSEFTAEWWGTHIQEQDSLYAAHIHEKRPKNLVLHLAS